MPNTQIPVQSALRLQDFPLAHVPHVPPPQSTSVSAPFFTLSEQLGAWQTLPVHTPDVQSALMRQDLTLAHAPHVPPPQSTSVSSPFFTLSEQLGAWQTLPVHTADAQSPAAAHACVATHVPHVPPPQSTSVSSPFFTLSEQLGAWQAFPVHTPDVQSPATEHACVATHVPHVPPPQSTSVSAPFFTPSAQVAAAQLPPVHTPEGHTVPQLPQLAGSAERLFSQPVAAFTSQSAKPTSQDAIPHAPAVQPGVPLATEQALPHAPQVVTLVSRSASQPSAGLALQSAKLTLQEEIPHAPLMQFGVALGTLQALPHEPQCDVLVLMFASQPFEEVLSQFPNPALQVPTPHVEPLQPAVAFAGAGHTLPHPPQWTASVVVSTHAAEQTTWPEPQQVDGAPVQVKPLSVTQVDEQPSLSAVFPSSHVSGPSTVPLPQPLTHCPPEAQR